MTRARCGGLPGWTFMISAIVAPAFRSSPADYGCGPCLRRALPAAPGSPFFLPWARSWLGGLLARFRAFAGAPFRACAPPLTLAFPFGFAGSPQLWNALQIWLAGGLRDS